MKTLMKLMAIIVGAVLSGSVQADLFAPAADIGINNTEWALPGINRFPRFPGNEDPPSFPFIDPSTGNPATFYLRTNYFIGTSTLPNNGGEGAGFLLFVDSSDADAPVLRPNDAFTLISIGHAWYGGVGTGMVIDADFVTGRETFYDNFNVVDTSGEIVLTEDEPFYMAFWLGGSSESGTVEPMPGAPGEGDVYGWMELEYAGGELNLLRSAAQNDGTSIIVGQIPEPSSVLLLLLGGGGGALLRRFLRSTGSPYD